MWRPRGCSQRDRDGVLTVPLLCMCFPNSCELARHRAGGVGRVARSVHAAVRAHGGRSGVS